MIVYDLIRALEKCDGEYAVVFVCDELGELEINGVDEDTVFATVYLMEV